MTLVSLVAAAASLLLLQLTHFYLSGRPRQESERALEALRRLLEHIHVAGCHAETLLPQGRWRSHPPHHRRHCHAWIQVQAACASRDPTPPCRSQESRLLI